jgi:O-antigen/teichoic acid export membrane protein
MTGGGLVLLLAIATILLGLYQINVNIIILVKQTKWLVLIITVAAIANLGVNLVLIPIMGIIGAAISAIVSNLILAVAAIIWARNVIRYRISIKFIAKVTVGAILMAWCISFIHIGGILGIAVISIAGVMIISLWLWLTRAFSAEDIKLIKEIILGFKQGALLR